MPPRSAQERSEPLELSERQAAVLRGVVAGYVGDALPVGSKTLAHQLAEPLSSASIRNTLAELAELGLVEKPHPSAGRIPTERGLRIFVDAMLSPADLALAERRELSYRMEGAEAGCLVQMASALLSVHSRQLGFVMTPALERVVLRYVSLVRLSTERLLVVLVSESGAVHRRVVEDDQALDQADLDRIAGLLNERVAGRTLAQVRTRLRHEAQELRREASLLLRRALAVGVRALGDADGQAGDLVIETRMALLDQPEFRDPRRLRDLFGAIETKERLLQVLDRMLERGGVHVALGQDLDDPALERCALVAASYGAGRDEAPLGALGVIGPSRMDFNRMVALVDYLAELITERLRP